MRKLGLQFGIWGVILSLAGCSCGGDELVCGAGTEMVGGECVPLTTIVCGPGTVEANGECVPALLEPGHFTSPLLELQRLQGLEDHMHVAYVKYREADSRLFYCSYGFGVIDATDPQEMEYLAQDLQHVTPSGSPREPGCLHLAWDEDDPDLVYTTHRGNIDFAEFLSGWDLNSDPADPTALAPVQLPALQEPGVSYGGVDVENGLIYVALHENGLGIYDFDPSPGPTYGFARLGTATGLNPWSVVVRGTIAYVADGIGGLATVDVTDPAAPVLLGRAVFGGNAEDVVVDGDVAYVAGGSAGLVLVDIADPANPAVLSSVDTPGSAVSVAYSTGRAYVAAWNDVRVYDVADPGTPGFIGATRLTIEQEYSMCTGTPEVCSPTAERPDPTARTLAVAAYGDYVFIGNWWVPYSFELRAEELAPYMVLPEDVALMDFGPTAVGDTSTIELEVANHGTAPLTLYDNWIDNPAFSVDPRQVLIEPGASATLTLSYTATGTAVETAVLELRSDDPAQPAREAFLVGNQPGLGVGQPLPEVTATLVDGTTWSSSSAAGQVMLLAYFATF